MGATRHGESIYIVDLSCGYIGLSRAIRLPGYPKVSLSVWPRGRVVAT
jgi:hypothetical protein